MSYMPLLSLGLHNGQCGWFDVRAGPKPAGLTHLGVSHRQVGCTLCLTCLFPRIAMEKCVQTLEYYLLVHKIAKLIQIA